MAQRKSSEKPRTATYNYVETQTQPTLNLPTPSLPCIASADFTEVVTTVLSVSSRTGASALLRKTTLEMVVSVGLTSTSALNACAGKWARVTTLSEQGRVAERTVIVRFNGTID